MIQNFWTRWQNDYLTSLQQRRNWRQEQENLQVGQLVLIKCENVPPTFWAMGQIIATYPGKDGKEALPAARGYRDPHTICQ